MLFGTAATARPTAGNDVLQSAIAPQYLINAVYALYTGIFKTTQQLATRHLREKAAGRRTHNSEEK